MKPTIITALFTVVSLTITAQEKLIRIDCEDLAWQEKSPQYIFFNEDEY